MYYPIYVQLIYLIILFNLVKLFFSNSSFIHTCAIKMLVQLSKKHEEIVTTQMCKILQAFCLLLQKEVSEVSTAS